MGMRVDIVTLFPEMCQQVLDASILGRAAKRGYIETHCHQIRDYTLNKQKQTRVRLSYWASRRACSSV